MSSMEMPLRLWENYIRLKPPAKIRNEKVLRLRKSIRIEEIDGNRISNKN